MKSEIKVKTRVGKICYTNCLPFFHQLDKTGETLEFFEAVPTQINQAMQEGKIDIAPVSSLEYLNHQKNYLLLPEVAIGSRDFSGSVLLLSRERIEGLKGVSMAVSEESLSSAALLKILMKFKYKFKNQYVPAPSDPDLMLAGHEAALVIGDSALFYRPKEFVYKYDLSELWWNWTERPFCFAVWAIRRPFAEDHPQEVAAFWRRLKTNLNKNLSDLEALLKESLGMGFLDERFSKVFGYLFNLSYGLDKPMQEGLRLFFRMAHQLGISPRPKELEFFKPR